MTSRKLLAIALFVFPLTIVAQQQPPAPPTVPEGQRSEDVFKNIKTLKGVSKTDFLDSMRVMSASLGVQCNFCHVIAQPGEPQAFDKDDKKPKQTAREMIAMTMAINKDHFKGQQRIGCASCHHGHGEPDPLPPMELATKPEPPRERPPAGVTAAALIEKYIESLGGQAAIEKVTSRVETGTITRENGQSAKFEASQKGGDKYLMSVSMGQGTATQIYDGKAAWAGMGPNSRELEGLEVDRLKRAAELIPAADIKKRYPMQQLAGVTTVNDRKVYVIGVRGQGVQERFLFDTETGLLVRRMTVHRTPVGMMGEQVDYADWRTVDGVKIPFTVTRVEVGTRWVEKYDEVKLNTSIDDSKFVKP